MTTGNNLSNLNRKDFQKEINGKNTDLFILKNPLGMEVAVTNYGCAILSIMIPDKDGHYDNVILGHDSIDAVINSPEPFLSTIIGRYGNRIAKGCNDNKNVSEFFNHRNASGLCKNSI